VARYTRRTIVPEAPSKMEISSKEAELFKMRDCSVSLIVALMAVFACSLLALAQPEPQSQVEHSKAPALAPPHDLSGVWLMDEKRYHVDPRLYGPPSKEVPPKTPWAQQRYAEAKPGSRGGTGDSDNDPALHCDPVGFPRIMGAGPFEIIQIPGRILIFFEDQHARREIWMDGRSLPNDPDPTWYGYSVGRWDGDTLVVDTVGFNDRSWLDGNGDPHSDEMRVEERYRRPDDNTLELSMTINDPKSYTKPWVSTEPKIYKLRPKLELLESACVPEDEAFFLKTVREPAAPKPTK
jgi:hypothetical protein